MKLFTMLDDPRIAPTTKARYKAVVAKLEGEYLFEEERPAQRAGRAPGQRGRR